MTLFASPGFGVAEGTVICCGVPCCGWLVTMLAALIGCMFRSRTATNFAIMFATFVGVVVVYALAHDGSHIDDPFPRETVWRMLAWWCVSMLLSAVAVKRSYFSSVPSLEEKLEQSPEQRSEETSP